jgi:hypothetical protein
MQCANPNCDRGIGLVSYRRGWLHKRRFCSKRCRDDFNFERLWLLQPQHHPAGPRLNAAAARMSELGKEVPRLAAVT